MVPASAGQRTGAGLSYSAGLGAAAAAGCAVSSGERLLQPVEEQIDHRRRVERQHLADDQPADDRDAQRPPQLGARAGAERQRQAPSRAAMVVIMIGRKRSRQAW